MIVCLDTETTGLLKPGKTPALTQVAASVYRDEALARSWFVNPEIPDDQWEKDAMEITGINPERVKLSPSFYVVAQELASYMVGARVLLGWNIEHDVKVIAAQLERYGFQYNFPWPPVHFDLMHYASERCNIQGRQGRKFPKLEEAYQAIFGEGFSGAHDARADVSATLMLAEEIAAESLAVWL